MRYGELELQTNEIIVSSVQYRQMAERVMNTSPISRRSGNKYLSDEFTTKTIVMEGHVVSNSTSGLIGVVDNMHRYLALSQQDLIIDDTDRVYIATCSKAEFPELSFTRSTTPFTLEFLSVQPYAYGDNLNATFVMPSGVTTQTITTYISGSAYAEPQLSLTTIGTAGNAGFTKIQVNHTNTGGQVVISGTWSQNTETVLNYDNATITISGLLTDYTGNFTSFPVGTNSLQISFTGNNDFGVSGQLTYLPRFYF
jgi:hypothetical protein